MATPESEVIGVPAAAKILGVSQQAVRSHLRAGTLKATKRQAKFGPTWCFRVAVLRAFAAERYGREVPDEALAVPTPAQVSPQAAEGLTELYERIVALTAEATRYRTIAEVSESTLAAAEHDYQAQIAELTQELERLRGRGFWRRMRGK
jgi:predicted ArsR family transcriptional regulator